MRVLRSILALAFAASVALATFADANPGVLLWQICDPSIDDHGTLKKIDEYASPTLKDNGVAEKVNVVRIKATRNGDAAVYLDMFVGAEPFSGMDVAEVEDIEAGGNWAGPMWASFDKCSGDIQSYTFIMELGYMSENGSKWDVLAVSSAETYASLEKFISHSPVDFPTYDPWSPNTFAIPEPSSALLILIGGALLALRRKEVRS